jgi:hypothetical protein
MMDESLDVTGDDYATPCAGLPVHGSLIIKIQPFARSPELSAIRRQHRNRDHAIQVAFETGLTAGQQIAKELPFACKQLNVCHLA